MRRRESDGSDGDDAIDVLLDDPKNPTVGKLRPTSGILRRGDVCRDSKTRALTKQTVPTEARSQSAPQPSQLSSSKATALSLSRPTAKPYVSLSRPISAGKRSSVVQIKAKEAADVSSFRKDHTEKCNCDWTVMFGVVLCVCLSLLCVCAQSSALSYEADLGVQARSRAVGPRAE